MARPTKYTPELLAKAQNYLDDDTEVFHSHIGLAYLLGISNSTFYEWITHKDKEEFSDIAGKVLQRQYITLVVNGLNNTSNSGITKLMLGKHGYSDKVDTTSSDGSMSPKSKIELVAKEFDV